MRFPARAALIPARVVDGIRLTEDIFTRPLTWIDAWNGQKWENLSVDGKETLKDQATLLALTVDGTPVVHVSGICDKNSGFYCVNLNPEGLFSVQNSQT